ncbi:MAG: PfkB domain protein [Jatrophihabitantaceae bacterium]|nr:PfkB domain protein [Jatrophihabitantaceae bacterium]
MLTVIGEALIDMVGRRGSAQDRSTYRAIPGGSPLNVAVGLARLGGPTTLLARLSGDAFGQVLRAHALGNGVALAGPGDVPEPSTLAIASLDEEGIASYAFYVGGTSDWQWTAEELRRIPADTTILHTGSLASWIAPGGALITETLQIRRASAQCVISYDPNVRPGLLAGPDAARELIEPYLRIAHIVKASDADLEWLYPDRDPLDSLRAWSGSGPDLVVLTRGGQGAAAIGSDGALVTQMARPVQLVDTVGAGDAFMAGLLGAVRSHGLDRPDAIGRLDAAAIDGLLREAGEVAALTCEREGADPPTAAQLAAALRRR